MSARVEILNEVTTVEPSPEGTWTLALQWCRHVDDEAGSSCYGYRFIWRDQDGNLRSATEQAQFHSLALIRDLLRKAEAAGWEGHDVNAVCDSRQRRTHANDALTGEVPPQGTLALIGAWGEIDDHEVDRMIEDIYEGRRLNAGRHVELED